jgi:hypothetical protein
MHIKNLSVIGVSESSLRRTDIDAKHMGRPVVRAGDDIIILRRKNAGREAICLRVIITKQVLQVRPQARTGTATQRMHEEKRLQRIAPLCSAAHALQDGICIFFPVHTISMCPGGVWRYLRSFDYPNTRAHICACVCVCVHTHIHTYIHTYTHTYAHTREKQTQFQITCTHTLTHATNCCRRLRRRE